MPESTQQPKAAKSELQTILFIITLSLVCATILSTLASVLAAPQEMARNLDRNKQMMIAAKVYSYGNYFLLSEKGGKLQPAKYEEGKLVPGDESDIATKDEILDIFKRRFIPMLVDKNGDLTTFENADIDYDEYLSEYMSSGYYKQPLKLVYKLLSNGAEFDDSGDLMADAAGWIFPINGLGLWDAIYGYLAIEPDGVTVIGTTWYDQKETPGLGANISEEEWQHLFPGKKLFQPDSSGEINLKSAPIGINVVKGKVAEVYGDSPKAKSAVDGMSGATLTGNGVTDAYRHVLAAYRPFLIQINEKYRSEEQSGKGPAAAVNQSNREKGL